MNHFLAREGDSNQGFLNESDSHHASRVLRLSPGEHISISYSDGNELGEGGTNRTDCIGAIY